MADTKKVFMYVGIGCGAFLLIIIVTCLGVGFYAKHKIDQAGGLQGAAAQMVVTGLNMGAAPLALTALPEPERKEAGEVFKSLQTKAKDFDKKDLKDLSDAMEHFTRGAKEHENRLPTPEEARAFVAEVKAVAERH